MATLPAHSAGESGFVLQFLPIIAIVLAATSLIVTLLIGVRTRNIFPAKLEFHFRSSPELHPSIPKRLRDKVPVATAFVHSRLTVAAYAIRLPLFIKNTSAKKISDVSVSLLYPEAYFIPNEEHKEAIEEAQQKFPQHAKGLGGIFRQLDLRECTALGGLVNVRYNIGSLRPGESFSCEELMRVPQRGKAFADRRYELTMFGAILERLKDLPQLLGVCHVTASILSEAMHPIRRQITVIAGHSDSDKAQIELFNPFAEAHWLNEMPRGGKFRRNPMRWPWKRLPPLVDESPVDVVFPQGKFELTEDRQIALVSDWLEAGTTTHGFSDGDAGLRLFRATAIFHNCRDRDPINRLLPRAAEKEAHSGDRLIVLSGSASPERTR